MIVEGQFVLMPLCEEKLRKALELAEKVIKRNKKLGDLLSQS